MLTNFILQDSQVQQVPLVGVWSTHTGVRPHVPTLREQSWYMQERLLEVIGLNAGSSNYLCLHNSLQLLHYIPGVQDARAQLRDTQYITSDSPPAFGHLHSQRAPCAVCYSSGRTATITIPGRTSCRSSWTREYYGYFMRTSGFALKSGRAPICVDNNAQAASNSINHAGSQLFFMEIRRNGNLNGAEITRVVCTK